MKKMTPPYLTEEKKQEYLRNVEIYKDLSFDFLWDLVPSQKVPRSYGITKPQTIGCLLCGHKANEHGRFPYTMDFINKQWKITCPGCGHDFPTNDFAAYYKGGLDENGIFQPELAKKHNDELIAKGERGNLVNILYPEMGETWGVDAGPGYIHEDGVKYTFVGCYTHFMWYFGPNSFMTHGVSAYRNAYLATGDVKYAEQGIVLLDRIADIYPSLTVSEWRYEDGYLHSDGCGLSKGKAVGCIWETGLVSGFIKSFLTYGELLQNESVPNAVAFLKSKDPKKNSGQAIWDNIMSGIVAQVYPAIRNGDILGNNGSHQETLALAAVAWDKLPETKEWLDFNFRTGTEAQRELVDKTKLRSNVTGCNISALLVDRVDRDGQGDEASPSYNSIWLNGHMNVAQALEGYELSGMEDRDLYKHPKFRKMFTAMYPVILSDIYTSKIGDTGICGDPMYAANTATLLRAFLKYGDPEFAQAAYYISKNKLENLDVSNLPEAPDSIREKVKSVIEKYGTLELGGTLMTGYGFAALRDGKAGDMFTDPKTTTQRALTLYFGRNFGHGHHDTLNMTIYAYGMDLMPDMGYPRYCDMMDMHRVSVTNNTLSHNTVVVDESSQTPQIVSNPLHFDYSERVKLLDIAAEDAYTGITDTYRRTSAMIKIDGQDSYIVDFFRVSGGGKHVYSFHGAEQCGVETTGLDLVKQADENGNYIGTYAGADTEYPINADVKDLTGARYIVNIDKQIGTVGDFSVDYNVCDTWNILGNGAHAPTDVHLKLTMLGRFDEVTVADILPPENKVGNPKKLRYVLAKREGEALKSCYTAVIEPYRAKSRIASIEAMTVTENGKEVCPMCARAVKVTLTNGRVDCIVNAVDPNALYTVSDGETEFAFSGFFGVWTREAGKDSYYLNDGTRIGEYLNSELSAVTGTVVDFTRELAVENEIIVEAEQAAIDTDALSGCLINVEKSEPGRNGAYRIKSAAFREDGKLAISIGDVTPIRSYVDAYDFAKGYVYDIAEGKRFRIPLAKETK